MNSRLALVTGPKVEKVAKASSPEAQACSDGGRSGDRDGGI